ncbi:unnamed protein product, partial [Closterium sp. NIES-53]
GRLRSPWQTPLGVLSLLATPLSSCVQRPVRLPVWSLPPLVLHELDSCVESGVCCSVSVRPWVCPLLVSPPVPPDPPPAPPPWSPLLASSPRHGLPCPCLWSPPVPPSPSPGACPYLRSLRRGAAARRSSLLRVSLDRGSAADSSHGR